MNSLMTWFQKSTVWAGIDAGVTIFSLFVTVGTLFFSYRNWQRGRKQLENISMHFIVTNEDKTIKKDILITKITRKDCIRSEIQGILRNKLVNPKINYKIAYLSKKEYYEQIFEIQNAKRDTLNIFITDVELAQFDVS